MQILAVIVRYKVPLAESETVKTMANNFAMHVDCAHKVKVLIWDNSPEPSPSHALPFDFLYRHSSKNVGVSGAYNAALELAMQMGCQWMLLLDQDTSLPSTFLVSMHDYGCNFEDRHEIAAVAPFLVDGELVISPGQLLFNRVKLIKPPFQGIHPGKLYAANSGTLIRVDALKEIGGFNEDFWLDLSDIVAFHELYARGRVLYIAGDLRLPHKVTLNDYEGSMSPQRYTNFVSAEGAYWDTYRSFAENLIQTLRLFARAVKQWLRFKNKAYAKITIAYAFGRVFRSRDARLNSWRESSTQRSLPLVEGGKVVS